MKENWGGRLRHLAYSGAWKKLEPVWDVIIRTRQVNRMLPTLESVLNSFGDRKALTTEPPRGVDQRDLTRHASE